MGDTYKDKESLIDAFFDHVFPESEGEVSEEDEKWFNEKVATFFDRFTTDTNTGGNNAPRRRRTQTGTPPRRRRQTSSSDDSQYGSRTFFG